MSRPFSLDVPGGVCLAVAAGLLWAPTWLDLDTRTPVGLALAAALGSGALAAAAVAGALLVGGATRATLGLARPRSGVLQSAGFVAGTLAWSHLLDTALHALGWREQSVLAVLDRALESATPVELAAALAGLAVAPGIAEELLFRGLVLQRARRIVGPAAAVAISALAFGVIHLDFAQGAAAALLGVYLGLVALATGGVAVPIACHVANNAVAVLQAATGVPATTTPFLLLAVAALVAGLSFRAALARRPPAPKR